MPTRPRDFALLFALAACGCTASPAEKSEAHPAGVERAALTPSVGAEFALDAPTASPGSGYGTTVGAASNAAGTTLVVWSSDDTWTGDVLGKRIDAGGNVLDVDGIPISIARFGQFDPVVASDGDGWFVVWQDQRSGAQVDVYGTRVDASGQVLDPDGILFSAAHSWASGATVASDGSSWFVSWFDVNARVGNSLYDVVRGARVNADGSLQDPGGFEISQNAFSLPSGRTAVVDLPSSWLVLYGAYGSSTLDVMQNYVTTPASVQPATLWAGGATQQSNPAAACGGSTCLVAWEDVANGLGSDIVAQVIGRPPVTLTSAGSSPVVAFDGTNYTVAWAGPNSTVEAAQVSPGGGVVTSATIEVASGAAPAIAQSGSGTLIAFTGTDGLGAVEAKSVSALGDVSSEFVVSPHLNRQTDAQSAGSRDAWLVTWLDTRASAVDKRGLYGARVDASGAVLDSPAFQIAVAANVTAAAVSSDGAGWLVLWSDDGEGVDYQIHATRIGADGSVLDPGGILLDGNTRNWGGVSVGFNGTDWLVEWNSDNTCRATRMNRNGEVLDVGGLVVPFCGTVVDGPGEWLVTAVQSSDGANFDAYEYRVAGDGSVLDASPVSLTGGQPTRTLGAASAAWGTGSWLMLWEDVPSGSLVGGTIYGKRLSAGGTFLDSTPLTISSINSASPSVSYNGTDWLVDWSDWRVWSGTSLNLRPPSEIYAARVSNAGALLDPGGFAISLGASDRTITYDSPYLTAGPGGRELVVYAKGGTDPGGMRARLIASDCVASSQTDTTCDGVDDDCNGIADDGCVVGAGGSGGTTGQGGETSTGGASASGGISMGGMSGGGTSGGGTSGAGTSSAGESSAGTSSAGESSAGTSSGGESTGGTTSGGTSSAGTTASGGRGGTGAAGSGAHGGELALGGEPATGGGPSASGAAGESPETNEGGEASVTGGRPGSGGQGNRSATSGGAGGKSGASTATAGHGASENAGKGGLDSGSVPPPDDGNCGCAVPRRHSPGTPLAGLALAVAIVVRRRRVRRER